MFIKKYVDLNNSNFVIKKNMYLKWMFLSFLMRHCKRGQPYKTTFHKKMFQWSDFITKTY